MKTLSSSMTFYYKYVFSTLWIGMFGFAAIAFHIDNKDEEWLFLFAFVFGVLVSYLQSGRIKRVKFDGENFHVSNYLRSEIIHKSKVENISGSVLFFPELVWIRLKDETSFGRKISFMSKYRFTFGFSRHPVVEELKAACGLK